MKKIANCIHHTHWDLIWYFTVQDATVQFSYNMKELLKAFRDGRIIDFFLDGQTAPLDEYLKLNPADINEVSSLVKSGKLIIGPFNSQLDSFISSGESVINNLRLGIKSSASLGKVSKVAYLPDSFGHSCDFPKIFNGFGINDFVITRGVGDEYGVGSEFFLESNDGSKVLVCTMIAGYGYGCYAFRDGTLFDESAKDYNKISVSSLIKRLLSYSTLKNEFVFPIGFDQNPVMLDIKDRIDFYNKANEEIEFKYTTWQKFCNHVRKDGMGLKTYRGELNSPQYHRIHRSIFSGRSDIKALQDECERRLTYELQPISTILDSLGIDYNHALIDSDWERLVKCQTHSSANLTDETNNYILRETRNVLNQVKAHIDYLLKLMSISVDKEFGTNGKHPLIVFNTLPYKRGIIFKSKVLTKTKDFTIIRNNHEIAFEKTNTVKKNCGVLRKDKALIDHSKDYYESDILIELDNMKGLSYEILTINENDDIKNCKTVEKSNSTSIENEKYLIRFVKNKGICITDKESQKTFNKAIYLEDSGDEGDSFDYSYPENDYVIKDYLQNANVYTITDSIEKKIVLDGTIDIPKDLRSRSLKVKDSKLNYKIELILKEKLIEIEGVIKNRSRSHRSRICINTENQNQYSYAGTQFGYIKRDVRQKSMDYWKRDKWFEEPSATWPLLNHVTSKSKENCVTVFTKSSKEYEFIGTKYKDIAITLFRSYGAMGYPDLNRRPGRPSGLDYRVFNTKETQMIGDNNFRLALMYASNYNPNSITKEYVEYAVDEISFEGQDFDKSLETILYFPTNKLEYTLPSEYSLFHIENFEGCFSTIIKDDNSNTYILRLYNCAMKPIKIGKLKSNRLWKLDSVNLLGKVQKRNLKRLPVLCKGQLINIRFKKGGVKK